MMLKPYNDDDLLHEIFLLREDNKKLRNNLTCIGIYTNKILANGIDTKNCEDVINMTIGITMNINRYVKDAVDVDSIFKYKIEFDRWYNKIPNKEYKFESFYDACELAWEEAMLFTKHKSCNNCDRKSNLKDKDQCCNMCYRSKIDLSDNWIVQR